MKELSKKQKLIGFVAILVVAVILAIVITTSIISNNDQVASEGYSATTANAGSSLIANYILNGITIGGITGRMDVLDTSDATATPEDIAKGKTAYVDGEKITGTRVEPISNEDLNLSETNVYYADIDNNETVDGVIFADLAGEEESGDTYYHGTYEIPSVTNLKQYYIREENYTDDFGAGKVIAPIEGTSGNERFYVLALEDINSGTTYTWYHASQLPSVYTEEGFGSGRENTKIMLQMESGYSSTMWGAINGKTGGEKEGGPEWFVPSSGEWRALAKVFFNRQLIINDYGINFSAWSSSQSDASYAITFRSTGLPRAPVSYVHNSIGYVRLATTF